MGHLNLKDGFLVVVFPFCSIGNWECIRCTFGVYSKFDTSNRIARAQILQLIDTAYMLREAWFFSSYDLMRVPVLAKHEGTFFVLFLIGLCFQDL